MITGIILAAGVARRMGQLKQLLPLGNHPIVWHVATAACHSQLDAVILVTGARADAVTDVIHDLPIKIIHNVNWEDGQAGSLATGIKQLTPDTEAVMFLLADQPLVTPTLIDSLIDAYYTSGQSIICPFYADLRGNPVLFDWQEWKDALSTLSGDQGARKIIVAHPESVHPVPVASAEILWDVDTEEDYQRMCAIFSKNNPSSQDC
ncbi:MAG TPA: nucleotidyltransferase family protein [Negativicutes bacterium]|nr:nucleotidyltransferase family protein [Negativicutes bacterium]